MGLVYLLYNLFQVAIVLTKWLGRYASLVSEYLELEEACMEQELLENRSLGINTEQTAAPEAKVGVASKQTDRHT